MGSIVDRTRAQRHGLLTGARAVDEQWKRSHNEVGDAGREDCTLPRLFRADSSHLAWNIEERKATLQDIATKISCGASATQLSVPDPPRGRWTLTNLMEPLQREQLSAVYETCQESWAQGIDRIASISAVTWVHAAYFRAFQTAWLLNLFLTCQLTLRK